MSNLKENQRRYYIKHQEKLKEKSRKRNLTNKEERKKYNKMYREKNREKLIALQREYSKTNKDQRREYSKTHKIEKRNYDRLTNYGINNEQYNILFLEQKGKCAICGKEETMKFKGELKPLAIDHNHTTGEVRGLLCHHCNVGLGHFEDDIGRLEKAKKYLQIKHKNKYE